MIVMGLGWIIAKDNSGKLDKWRGYGRTNHCE